MFDEDRVIDAQAGHLALANQVQHEPMRRGKHLSTWPPLVHPVQEQVPCTD
jgi:hypothetical protein